MVSNINELVDEAVEIASQDFASVKVEKGIIAKKKELLYLINQVFNSTEFKHDISGVVLNSDYWPPGICENINNGRCVVTIYVFDDTNYRQKKENPKHNPFMDYVRDIENLVLEVHFSQGFEKAKVFAKAYEHVFGKKAKIIQQFHEEVVDPVLEEIVGKDAKRVNVNEPVHLIVGRMIKEQGYEIADFQGRRMLEPFEEGCGILKPGGKNFIGMKRDAFYVGNIWLNNKQNKAKENESWYVEVRGKEFLSELTTLAATASSRAGKNITVDVKLLSDISTSETHFNKKKPYYVCGDYL